MGRNTKLTPEVQQRIVDAITEGNYAQTAAALAGIGESTYYRWLDTGKDPEADPIYREFREAVKEAEAIAEANAIAAIRQAGRNGTWQAEAWYLERRHNERWGKRDQVRQEISGPEGGPVEVIDARAALLAILEQDTE